MLNVYTFYDDKDMDSPIRRKCIESWKENIPDSKITILDHSFLDNVPKEFWSPHYQYCKDNNLSRRYLSDSVRLKMSQAIDNFIYLDSDVFTFRPLNPKILETECSTYYLHNEHPNIGGFLWNKGKDPEIQKAIDWYDNPSNYSDPDQFLLQTDISVLKTCNCLIPPVNSTWFTHIGLGYMKEYCKGKKIIFLNEAFYKSIAFSNESLIKDTPDTIFVVLRTDISPCHTHHATMSRHSEGPMEYWPVIQFFPLYPEFQDDLEKELNC